MAGDNTIDQNPQKDPNDYLAPDVSMMGPLVVLLYILVVYLLIKNN